MKNIESLFAARGTKKNRQKKERRGKKRKRHFEDYTVNRRLIIES